MSSTSYSQYIGTSNMKCRLSRAGSIGRFILLVMLAASALLAGQAWAATTRWVDAAATSAAPGTGCGTSAGYTTIGAAIADSIAGDTITVCPGVYAEQVNVNKTLKLLGEQAGVDARTRPFVIANESIIDHPCGPVQITADNAIHQRRDLWSEHARDIHWHGPGHPLYSHDH